jgi:hypothetical protein
MKELGLTKQDAQDRVLYIEGGSDMKELGLRKQDAQDRVIWKGLTYGTVQHCLCAVRRM